MQIYGTINEKLKILKRLKLKKHKFIKKQI